MGTVMKGAEVAKEMKETLIREANELKEKGIDPCLAIIRVGARSADLSYERGAKKRMELAGIACKVVELSEDITQEEFEEEFQKVNQDPEVHGILLFRPLPKHLNEEKIKNIIHPFKDVDCMSPVNLAKVFSGDDSGFAPCTPEAVIKMLEHYGISLCGKKVTVVGRSMVVGRPLSMLLLKRHATITICHTRTKDLEKVCREADILIIGGTSLNVYPAAALVDYFRGENLILINRDETPLDASCTLVVHGKVGEVLGALPSFTENL